VTRCKLIVARCLASDSCDIELLPVDPEVVRWSVCGSRLREVDLELPAVLALGASHFTRSSCCTRHLPALGVIEVGSVEARHLEISLLLSCLVRVTPANLAAELRSSRSTARFGTSLGFGCSFECFAELAIR
jgi:hypothetical protein